MAISHNLPLGIRGVQFKYLLFLPMLLGHLLIGARLMFLDPLSAGLGLAQLLHDPVAARFGVRDRCLVWSMLRRVLTTWTVRSISMRIEIRLPNVEPFEQSSVLPRAGDGCQRHQWFSQCAIVLARVVHIMRRDVHCLGILG